ncbi:hypothetical protein ACHHYP_08143 [Achlya hypogyna]|uniref:Uncharacterized protein n=1 Tax=Achlya hypogyna TaxID=1202772 RepID=A0A1V9ZL77_ACHHY|nr:hypothetical protein ACHHYP_08143 [Achlya hypogyna]
MPWGDSVERLVKELATAQVDSANATQVSCPNDCSGHGQCVDISSMALLPNVQPLSAATTYSLWDAHRIYGCVCDSSWPVGLGTGEMRVGEWFGPDCSLRHCPSGDDPMTAVDETNCAGWELWETSALTSAQEEAYAITTQENAGALMALKVPRAVDKTFSWKTQIAVH